jgi:hypothetical protein
MWKSWPKDEQMEIRKMALDDWASLLEIGEMAWKVPS